LDIVDNSAPRTKQDLWFIFDCSGTQDHKDTGNPQAGYERYGGITPESAYEPEVDFAAASADNPTLFGVSVAGEPRQMVSDENVADKRLSTVQLADRYSAYRLV
jgi:hypothetical protein